MQRPTVITLLAPLLASLALPAAAADQAPHPCPDPRVSVRAEDPALAGRVCAAVARARPTFEDCGLTQTRPVTVEVVESAAALGGDPRCLGLYDCGDEEVRLLSPAALARAIAPGSAAAAITPEAFFESLAVHEMAHALLAQHADDLRSDRTLHEYVAYALQLDSLDTTDRAALVVAFPRSRPVAPAEITGEVHAMSPLAFAVNAWLHFATPGNGCAFVRGLIEGREGLGGP